MTRFRIPQPTMLTRIILFLAAFFVVLILQMGIDQYQTKNVIQPLELRTENTQSISQFLNEVEGCMTLLDNYRWDYGDTEALITSLEKYRTASANHLKNVPTDLEEVSEEQYLLANAVHTTYGTLMETLTQIIALLQDGDTDHAAMLYFDRAEPCGTYLRQYTQQLLERALLDSRDSYAYLTVLNKRLNNVQTSMLILCLVLGGVVIVSVLRLLRSIMQMSRASQAISRGDFDVADVDERQQDEIGHMAKAFNEMKRSMKHQVNLLNEKNEMERALHIKEREALELQNLMEREKLQQLRSQINPHFLFNTLNLIMYTAQQEGASRTKTLIGALSRLFRSALSSNEVQVPLAREVHLVDEYYSLLHARFGDRILMYWDISPDVELTETITPSFILQPLVENAFYHGIAPKEEGGRVTISLHIRDKQLILSVWDNGVGMTEEEVAQLRSTIRSHTASDEHIGVYNVAARIRLWSQDSSMRIESEKEKGTRVTLTIPLVTLMEEEEDLNV